MTIKSLGYLALLCLVGGSGCKGSPAAPPDPTPNVAGAWTGTLNISDQSGAVTNSCTHSWNVTSQNAGSISGTAQTAGSCRTTGGTISGTVAMDGTLSLGPNILALDAVCTRLAGNGYTGSSTSSSVSAKMTESVRCTPQGQTATEFTRTLTIALQR